MILEQLLPQPYKSTTEIEMSYNPRMSIVPQQQNRGKKKEEDSDAFMKLVINSLKAACVMLILAARQGNRRMHQ